MTKTGSIQVKYPSVTPSANYTPCLDENGIQGSVSTPSATYLAKTSLYACTGL